MLIDLPRFVQAQRPGWDRLAAVLEGIEKDPHRKMDLTQLEEFHLLYQKTASDLAKLSSSAAEPALRNYLEALVARAYGEIHESRERSRLVALYQWFTQGFPSAFRRQFRAFQVATTVMFVGALFGGFALILDPEAKEALMPFAHLTGSPEERVHEEETRTDDALQNARATFSSSLMANNIRVAILTLATGILWGAGTVLLLFYNGVILGAVAADYLFAGEAVFLFGWLLPHGVIEIPAVLVAGQGGILLGRTLIGFGTRQNLAERLRGIQHDLLLLIGGAAMMLVWAGIVESFLSQYHEPVIPYGLKISFGLVELIGLGLFLTLAGRSAEKKRP